MRSRATSTARARSRRASRSACAGARSGHHQAIEKEERFSKFRSEEIAQLIWIMGAIAAEQVFYGENSRGVGGDMQAATSIAGWMAGASAMGPQRIEFDDGKFRTNQEEDEARAKVQKRLQAIGERLMASATVSEAFGSVLNSRDKRPIVAELLGYAYYVAYNTMTQNKAAVEKVADDACRAQGDPRRRGRRAARSRQPQAREDRLPRGVHVATSVTPGRQHAGKFVALYAILVVVAGAAIGLGVHVATEKTPRQPGPWSGWRPNTTDVKAADQIANYVGAQYKDPKGKQLLDVRGTPLIMGSKQVQIAERKNAQSRTVSGVAGTSVEYNMCGSTSSCSVPKGISANAAGVLTRREAYELALLTFKYIPSVSNVVVLTPPLIAKTKARAIFIRRDDVQRALDAPEMVLPGERDEDLQRLAAPGAADREGDRSLHLPVDPRRGRHDPDARHQPDRPERQGLADRVATSAAARRACCS